MKRFADEHGLLFYDMNDESIYNALNIDFKADFADRWGHCNLSGAEKITDYMGKLLSEKYGLTPHKAEQWEESRSGYLKFKDDYNLRKAEKLNEFLRTLKKNYDRYTVLIAISRYDLLALDEATKDALKSLGLSLDLIDAKDKCYYAVISNGKVMLEKISEVGASCQGSLYNGRFLYVMEADYRDSSITVNSKKKVESQQGIKIAVFDNETQMMISSVSFDVNTGTYAKPGFSDGDAVGRVSYARIDVTNKGAYDNDVEVLDMSDADAKVTDPEWMAVDGRGRGRLIQSRKGAMSFKLKCKGDGKLSIHLLGPDVRDYKDKRIPVWLLYSKFVVDGKVIFDGVRPFWHDKRQIFTEDVKDGRVLDVQVFWMADFVMIGNGSVRAIELSERKAKEAKIEEKENMQIKALTSELKKAIAEKSKVSANLKKLNASNKKVKERLDDIRSSWWYKVLHRLKFVS